MKISLTRDKNGIEFYSIPRLKDVQSLMIELLKIVDIVARKNNIKYWIDGGTLIGAVRHKGFIPWDDDIDVCLMKEDYDKFLPLLNDYIKNRDDLSLMFFNKNQYQYQYWFEYFTSNKIRVEYNGMKWPIRIDLFPMKLVKNEPSEIKKDRYFTDLAYYFVKGKVKYYPEICKEYKYSSLKKALDEKKKFFSNFDNYIKKNIEVNDKSKLLVDYSFGDIYIKREREYKKYTDIFPLSEIDFEGVKVLCPNNIDKYLKVLYNDYMTLPPLESRKQMHNSKISIDEKKVTDKETEKLLKEQNELFYYADKMSYKLYVLIRQFKRNGLRNVYREVLKPFVIRKLTKKISY